MDSAMCQKMLTALGVHTEKRGSKAILTVPSGHNLQLALIEIVESLAISNIPYSVHYEAGGDTITKIVYETESKPAPRLTIPDPTIPVNQLTQTVKNRIFELALCLNMTYVDGTHNFHLTINDDFLILKAYLLAHNMSFMYAGEKKQLFVTLLNSTLKIEEMVPFERAGNKIKFISTELCNRRFKMLENQIQLDCQHVGRQYFLVDSQYFLVDSLFSH